MDPVTAAMNAVTAALTLATKVWEATPPALQAQNAGDWAKFLHNTSEFFLLIQGKIMAGTK